MISWGGDEESGASWFLVLLWAINSAFATCVAAAAVPWKHAGAVSVAWTAGIVWNVVARTNVRASEKIALVAAGVLMTGGIYGELASSPYIVASAGIVGATVMSYSLIRNVRSRR